MNVFDLSAIVSPVAGAISGGMTVKDHNAMSIAIGIGTGLVIGRILNLGTNYISFLLIRITGTSSETLFQRLVGITSVLLLPMISIFGSIESTAYVIVRIIHV
jgi:hypothetical protein